jgi:hypothetical protein
MDNPTEVQGNKELSEREKIMKKMDEDIETMQQAFHRFSEEYGEYIMGITLQRSKGIYWRIDVIMNAELFDNPIIS